MKKIFIIFLLLVGGGLQAQLSINGAATKGAAQTLLTPAQIVANYLVGPGVTPTNVIFNRLAFSPNRDQCGFWNTNLNVTNLGFDHHAKGAILCTGKTIGALGPNDSTSFFLLPAIPIEGDADLALLSGQVIRDISILEFDFVATGLTLNFDYVFGSEEYPEFANTGFNDVFGFFLSGPGISGPYSSPPAISTTGAKNIALIPGTSTGVSINTINNGPTGAGPCVNCQYYMGNNKQDTQYDAFTRDVGNKLVATDTPTPVSVQNILRATSDLQCGGTYHIKLAIANASDNSYDSGVFLQNFTIPPMVLHSAGLPENLSACYGDTLVITSAYNGTEGYTFKWFKDGVPYDGVALPLETGPTLTINSDGTYRLEVYTNGVSGPCQLASDDIPIKYAPKVLVNDPVNLTKCLPLPFSYPQVFNIDQTTAILGSQDPNDFEVKYYDTSYQDAFDETPGKNIPTASLATYAVNSTPKTIWIRFYNVNTGCLVIKTFDIILNPLPIINGTLNVCQGSKTQLIASNSPASVNPWTSSNTAVATVDNNPGFEGLVTGVSAGTSVITYTDSNGCSTTATVTVNSAPVITGTLNACVGSTSKLASVNPPAATLPWDSSDKTVAVVDGTGLVSGIKQGTTTITYIDSKNCSSSVTFTVNALPVILGTTSICQGVKSQLSSASAPAASNAWVSSNSAVAVVDSAGFVTGVSGGTSTITYTDINGCTASLLFTVNPSPTISGSLNVCIGLTTKLTGSGIPNTLIPWISSDTAIALVDGTGLVTGVSVGTAIITYTDSTGCFTTATVVVNPLPTIGGTLSVCKGLTTQLIGSASPATPIAWVSSDTNVATVNNTGLVTGISAGNADITYTNSNGCVITVTVKVNALPTINGLLDICEGSNTQLSSADAPAGLNPWVSSDTTVATVNNTGFVTGLKNGNSTITFTNSNGCISTVTVTVKGLPTATISGTTTICAGTKAVITFKGTPNATVTYTVNPGSSTTILLDNAGNAILNTPALIPTTTYSIVSVSTSGPLVCSQNIVGQSATVTTTSAPIISKPSDYEACATNGNNNVSCLFDLQSKNTEITTDPKVQITYYYTDTAAIQGNINNAIPAGPFCNNVVNTQTIYVRAFDPLAPNCPSFTTLQLIVNPRPIPKANVSNLEMCDDNGDGLEDFVLTSKDAEIANGLSGVTISYYTTSNAAQDPTNPASVPLTSPYTSGSKTIWFNIKDNLKGCFSVGSFKIVVNALPKATQPSYPVYSLCDVNNPGDGIEVFDLNSKVSGILLGQTGMTVTFYPSPTDAQNNTNAITNLMYPNGVINSQIIGIRITNNKTGCFMTSTMELKVLPLPILLAPATYTVCDNNQDGLSTFDLNSLTSGITNGGNYTVTYYATLTEAQTGIGKALISPYSNTVPFVQIIYAAGVDNVTGCRSVVSVELNVEPGPIMPILEDLTKCDLDNSPQDGITLFDFTGQKNFILAAQANPGNYTVTFYEDVTLLTPIISITDYPGSDAQPIWVTIKDTAFACTSVGSFQLFVIAPLALTPPNPLNVCDDDATPNDEFYTFDLTIRNAEINQGTGYPVTYYPTLADAQAEDATKVILHPEAYMNETKGSQALGVLVTNPSGCKSITVLEIRVFKLPEPNTPPALPEKCDDNNPGDMVEVFDLTQNEAYIAGGDPTLTFHYYYNQADALAGGTTNEIIPATAVSVGQNVWIRIENSNVDSDGNHCFVVVEQPLKVNPLPFITDPLPPYRACDTDTDGFMTFDLSAPELTASILGPDQLPSDFTISYHVSAADANTGNSPLPASYTNTTPNSQDIYVRVVNNTTLCVNSSGVLTLAVEQAAFASAPPPFADCDNYDNLFDGINLVDLTQPLFSDAILGTQDPNVFILTYYHNQADADAGINEILDPQHYVTAANTDTVWVKVENSSNLIVPACYALTTIDITTEPRPNPVINTVNGVTSICVDFVTKVVKRALTLDSGIANPANYTFQWYEDGVLIPGATGSTYTVSTANATGATRNYTVYVSSTTPCDTTSNVFGVKQSGQASIPSGTLGYTVTNYFSENQTITVLIEGYGTYQYSLDDGPRQDSNVFENVFMGSHTITVWDNTDGVAYSCDELVIPNVQIIDYPRYFTPNGDGFHDTWNIVGLSNQPGAKIYIFDRFGKLLKEISPTGEGWDGTFTGRQMPADDYWFKVEYQENKATKEFKAHFSLKR